MCECVINGQPIELEADIPLVPEVSDSGTPSPDLEFSVPAEVCEKYRRFLERADAFLRKSMRGEVGRHVRATRYPLGTWELIYSGIREAVCLELQGVDELGAGEGQLLTAKAVSFPGEGQGRSVG